MANKFYIRLQNSNLVSKSLLKFNRSILQTIFIILIIYKYNPVFVVYMHFTKIHCYLIKLNINLIIFNIFSELYYNILSRLIDT